MVGLCGDGFWFDWGFLLFVCGGFFVGFFLFLVLFWGRGFFVCFFDKVSELNWYNCGLQPAQM